MAGRGKANQIDAKVGQAIRLRRTALGISQEDLGHRLGLTFQQIQKFEHGANRVSPTYLFQLSRALHVPIAYFFDRAEENAKDRSAQQFWMSLEGMALWRAYQRLNNATVRHRVLDLIRAIAAQSS